MVAAGGGEDISSNIRPRRARGCVGGNAGGTESLTTCVTTDAGVGSTRASTASFWAVVTSSSVRCLALGLVGRELARGVALGVANGAGKVLLATL